MACQTSSPTIPVLSQVLQQEILVIRGDRNSDIAWSTVVAKYAQHAMPSRPSTLAAGQDAGQDAGHSR